MNTCKHTNNNTNCNSNKLQFTSNRLLLHSVTTMVEQYTCRDNMTTDAL